MSKRILIVEDEKNLARFVSLELQHEGYDVVTADNGREGLEMALEKDFDLILLDLMLPEMDGFEVTRRLQQEKDTYIMMMTARDSIMDIVAGLDRGADDYIEKPFSPSVLIAKIKAMLAQYKRLTERDAMETNAIQSGEIRLDPKMMKVWVNEKEVHLKKKEFQLLEFLMRNRDIVFSKEELYSRVWGLDSYGDYATVAVHINRLREEIEDNPSDSKHIITVWGVGYKFV